VEYYNGNITDSQLVGEALTPRAPGQKVMMFHLASVLSANGERDFDHCISVNIDGIRTLLEGSRELYNVGSAPPTRFIFPSSIAAFGPQKEVSDDSKLLPEVRRPTQCACSRHEMRCEAGIDAEGPPFLPPP
jgi:nucleoside-diphosphate-sugar epimerase